MRIFSDFFEVEDAYIGVRWLQLVSVAVVTGLIYAGIVGYRYS
jgi:hypothetical protein